MTIWSLGPFECSKTYIRDNRSGRETITRVTGGMKVKADRDLSLLLIKGI